MTGIFDSGAGGLAALTELRRLMPDEDIVFLADVKHAPYGTKSSREIAKLASENISRLLQAGADRVLIACCTASACYGLLESEWRAASVPIITPTAKCAAETTEHGRIAVIATELTVRLRAFSSEIYGIDPTVSVTEIAAQPLVAIAEDVAQGTPPTEKDIDVIKSFTDRIKETRADTLVLGCTHFSHLEGLIKTQLKDIYTVDSARVGARFMARGAQEGCGRTLFLE